MEMAKFGVRVSVIQPGKFSRCTAINQEVNVTTGTMSVVVRSTKEIFAERLTAFFNKNLHV